MSKRKTSEASDTPTSLRASADSPSVCDGLDGLTGCRSGPAVSPARTFRAQAKERALLKASEADSGGIGLPLFNPTARRFCSLRTSLLCALAGLTTYSLVWREKATPAGRSWWVLGRSAHRTNETGCGSLRNWPTAKVATGDYCYSNGDHNRKVMNLSGAVKAEHTKNWPTPNERDYKDNGPTQGNRKSPNLGTIVNRDGQPDPANASTSGKLRDWSTPRADERSQRNSRDKGSALSHQVKIGNKGFINFGWVAQLMGYPDGWLDVSDENA